MMSVVKRVKKYMDELVEVVEDEAKKGNKDDALLFFGEIVAVKESLSRMISRTPKIYDKHESVDAIKERVKICEHAEDEAKRILKGKGWL